MIVYTKHIVCTESNLMTTNKSAEDQHRATRFILASIVNNALKSAVADPKSEIFLFLFLPASRCSALGRRLRSPDTTSSTNHARPLLHNVKGTTCRVERCTLSLQRSAKRPAESRSSPARRWSFTSKMAGTSCKQDPHVSRSLAAI